MNKLFTSTFYLKPTEYYYKFKVLYNTRFIGHIDERNEGKFIIQTDKLFLKFNGFGLDKEVLVNKTLKFDSILVLYKNKEYLTQRKTFIEMGKSLVYPDGEKIYLNLRYFNMPQKNSNQLSLFQEV